MRRKDFREMAGIAHCQMYEAMREGWDPRASTLAKFEAAIPDDWEPEEAAPERDAAA